jgi:Fe-S-cluster-containing dehydrogenase component
MLKRICKYCGKEFGTNKSAQMYCTKQCQIKANYKPPKKQLQYICEFCGGKFRSDRKKKYCSDICRERACRHLKTKSQRNKPTLSLEDINALARAEGLTYGQYFARYGYGMEGVK